MAFNKIFIQAGPTGGNTGWGELVNECTKAGIPIFAAASDSMTLLFDLQVARQKSGVKHTGNFIPTIDNDGNRFDLDYTVHSGRDEAHKEWQKFAKKRWQKALKKIPKELDPEIIAISLENEQRPYKGWGSQDALDSDEWQKRIPGFTGWADCFGWQAVYTGLEAIRLGFKYMAFGFAGGNPEEGTWEQPGMVEYLKLCDKHPDKLGLALHEYSFTQDLEDGWGDKLGRFKKVNDTCDKLGLKRPIIQIKEFGWGERDIPGHVPEAMRQLEIAAKLYAQYPNIHGAAIWTSQTGWGRASRRVPGLIPHIKEFTLKKRFPDPPPHVVDPNPPGIDTLVDPTPVDTDDDEKETHVRHQIVVNLLPPDATLDEKFFVVRKTDAQKETITQSADDAGLLVQLGNDKSFVRVWGANRWTDSIEDFFTNKYKVTTAVATLKTQ